MTSLPGARVALVAERARRNAPPVLRLTTGESGVVIYSRSAPTGVP